MSGKGGRVSRRVASLAQSGENERAAKKAKKSGDSQGDTESTEGEEDGEEEPKAVVVPNKTTFDIAKLQHSQDI